MIDSMPKLYDFVNRFGLEARREEVGQAITARFSTSGNRPTLFHAGQRVITLEGWEVWTITGWIPLAEFDDEGTAARVERFEALHNFATVVDNYRRARDRLRQGFEELHPDDRTAFPIPDFPAVEKPDDAYIESI